ncbi:MAG TPA: hypothetical protein VLI39_10980 [Sedimentisphaerales bacterium]|nr:hypothetical protein [Sedimentisphaerales bacterium]
MYANDVARYQRDMLDELLEYAGVHCPYYRHVFASHDVRGIEGFGRVPLLSKSDVRANAAALCSDRIKKEKVFRFNTGGSTGEPMAFYASRRAGAIDGEHQHFAFELAGYVPGDRILAFDGTQISERHFKRGIYWLRKSSLDLPYGKYHLSSHHFSSQTADRYIDFFLRIRPQFLRGYPSFITQFVRELRKQRVSVPFRIKAIQLTAEQVFDWQVDEIRRAFDCKVLRQYGHSEMCVFAFTAPDDSKYCCSPVYGVTEVLHSNGKHVDVGQVGEIVVTGLHNRGMPLIRYKTGDEAVYGGTCNGFTIFREILGRNQDYVLDASGNCVSVTGIVFGQHFHAFEHIQKWQMLQTIPGRVCLKVVKAGSYSDKDEAEIRQRFTVGQNLDVKIEYVAEIPPTSRGKHRFVINTCIEGLA